MRPINVTLCSTTWELAKQKTNFSAWVRRKLADEQRIAVKEEESRPLYQATCLECDKYYQHYQDFMMQTKYCDVCHNKCFFVGLLE